MVTQYKLYIDRHLTVHRARGSFFIITTPFIHQSESYKMSRYQAKKIFIIGGTGAQGVPIIQGQ